jgi:hypothetical protein
MIILYISILIYLYSFLKNIYENMMVIVMITNDGDGDGDGDDNSMIEPNGLFSLL